MLSLLFPEKIDYQGNALRYTLHRVAKLHNRADHFLPGVIDNVANLVNNAIGRLQHHIGRLHQGNEPPVQKKNNDANEYQGDRGYASPDYNHQVAPPG